MARLTYAARMRLKKMLKTFLILLAILLVFVGVHHFTLEPVPFLDDVSLRMYRFEVELALGEPQEISESGVSSETTYTFYRESSTCSETIYCTFSDSFLSEKLLRITVISVYPSEEAAKKAFLTYSAAIQAEYPEDEDRYCTMETTDGGETLTAGAKGAGVGIHYELELRGKELHMSCLDFH